MVAGALGSPPRSRSRLWRLTQGVGPRQSGVTAEPRMFRKIVTATIRGALQLSWAWIGEKGRCRRMGRQSLGEVLTRTRGPSNNIRVENTDEICRCVVKYRSANKCSIKLSPRVTQMDHNLKRTLRSDRWTRRLEKPGGLLTPYLTRSQRRVNLAVSVSPRRADVKKG